MTTAYPELRYVTAMPLSRGHQRKPLLKVLDERPSSSSRHAARRATKTWSSARSTSRRRRRAVTTSPDHDRSRTSSLKALNSITTADTADKVRIAEKITRPTTRPRRVVVSGARAARLTASATSDVHLQLPTTEGATPRNATPFDNGKRSPRTINSSPSWSAAQHLRATSRSPSHATYSLSDPVTANLANPELRSPNGRRRPAIGTHPRPVPLLGYTRPRPGTASTRT